jgi:HSP20 family molecular chaperone IbpA
VESRKDSMKQESHVLQGGEKVKTKEENKKQQVTPASRELLPFHSLQQEMNRLFEEFKTGWGWTQPSADHLTAFHTKVDMKDNEKDIVVNAELPGVDLKDLEISVHGN